MVDLSNGPIDPEATLTKEKAETKESSMPDVVLRDLIRVPFTQSIFCGFGRSVISFHPLVIRARTAARWA
jgi:hypothetical protein